MSHTAEQKAAWMLFGDFEQPKHAERQCPFPGSDFKISISYNDLVVMLRAMEVQDVTVTLPAHARGSRS